MVLKSHETTADPVVTDPGLYRVVFENERVRVLEYRDQPGDRTHEHHHPDSVLVPVCAFERRVSSGGRTAEVSLEAGQARWVGAQDHIGENIGSTDSFALLVELKEPAPNPPAGLAPLGPS
jgi:quercetin dioxygenase-like cupin family protein